LGWFLNTFKIVFTQKIQRMDSLNFFSFFFHIVKVHIPPSIACVLGATHLLAMTKHLGGVRPIVVGIALHLLTSHALCLNTFLLAPIQSCN
jgi:hypothetical protein